MIYTRHIVIVASYCLGEEPVIRNRIKTYVDIFAKRGWRVTVVSPHPKTTRGLETDKELDCAYIYAALKDYDRRNFMKRSFFEAIHARRLLALASAITCDVRLITIPSMFLVLRPLKQGRVVVDIRDLVWEYLPRNRLLYRLAADLFRFLALKRISSANIVTVSNPEEAAYVRSALPHVDPLLVTNGISKQQFDRIQSLSFEHHSGGRLRVTYVGNVGLAQNLTTLVSAVAGDERFEVVIVGSGNDVEKVRAEVKQRDAGNVKLVGQLPWTQAAEWYARSDILYAQLGASFELAVPSKLYEYLATGLRIVYGGSGAALELTKCFRGVTVIPPDNPNALAAALGEQYRTAVSGRMLDNVEAIRAKYIREASVESFEQHLAKALETDMRFSP